MRKSNEQGGNGNQNEGGDRIRQIITPITDLLDAPNDLPEFIPILKAFQTTLEMYKPLSEEIELPVIAKLEGMIEKILDGSIDVLSAIPTARSNPKRLWMRPNYITHPHYCIYWHNSIDDASRPQYQAIRASLLPILVRLQSAKKENSKEFQNYLYQLGLSIRKLTEPNDAEAIILRQLPTEVASPRYLIKQIEELLPGKISTSGDYETYGYIYRSLRWFETGIWEKRNTNSETRGGKREAQRHGGVIYARGTEIEEVKTYHQDAGESLHSRTFYVDTGGQLDVNRKDLDADPLQDSGKVSELTQIPTRNATLFNAMDRVVVARKRARYVAQAIEMGNQRLPITHATLSGFELKVFLEALADIEGEAWKDIDHALRDEIAAWGGCRFFLGRDSQFLLNILAITKEESRDDPEIAKWYQNKGYIWLPCQQPLHQAPEHTLRVIRPNQGFMLDVSRTLEPYLLKIVKKSKKTLKIFKVNLDDRLNLLINSLNKARGTALTLNRIGNVIPALIAQLAPNDEVMSVYFSGRRPNQHNPSVYSAVPVSRLQALFVEACNRVYEQAEIPRNFQMSAAFPTLISSDDEFVGSLHVPTIKTLQKTVNDLCEKIQRIKAGGGSSLHELHNAYTAYVLLFLMATTAIRAVRQPIPFEFNIDKTTGSCFVSEKDTDSYRNARLVWLNPLLIEQLEEYERHVTRLRQHLILVNARALDELDESRRILQLNSAYSPNRSKDHEILKGKMPMLFMMSTYGKYPIEIEPKRIEDLLGENWKLRLVSLRHFIRTELMHAGCSGVLINALLGHAERGESPWSKFSTLPPILWRKQLEQNLKHILDQLNFKLIMSPLLRSLP